MSGKKTLKSWAGDEPRSMSRRDLMSGGAAMLAASAVPQVGGAVAATASAAKVKLVPGRTAFLVLHMMNEQMHYKPGLSGYGPEFADANKQWRILEKTKAVLDACRKSGVQVIYVRMSYRPGYPELPRDDEGMPDKVRVRKQGLYKEGSWATEIAEEIKPQSGDIVVINQTASAFCYNDLDIILRNNDIRYLAMAGVSTKTIVACTAIEANLKGYFNYVLEDCCNSRGGRKEHDLFIREVIPAHAIVIESQQLIDVLART